MFHLSIYMNNDVSIEKNKQTKNKNKNMVAKVSLNQKKNKLEKQIL